MGGQESFREMCVLCYLQETRWETSFVWWVGGHGQRVVEFDCGSLRMCKRSQKSSLNHGGLCLGSLGRDAGRMHTATRHAHFHQQSCILWLRWQSVSTRRGRCHVLHRLQVAVNLMPIIFFLSSPKKFPMCPALAARDIVFGFWMPFGEVWNYYLCAQESQGPLRFILHQLNTQRHLDDLAFHLTMSSLAPLNFWETICWKSLSFSLWVWLLPIHF